MDRDKDILPEYRVNEEAVSWLLRIQEGFSQSDFREWRQWLSENDANAAEFDAVSKFWQETELVSDLPWPSDNELAMDTYDGNAALVLPPNSVPRMRRRPGRRNYWLASAASIAAICLIGFGLVQEFDKDIRNYHTTTAEHRSITLDDGSSITLGAESDVVVSYSRDVRQVELHNGEAYFKVAKDTTRPFLVVAGTRTVRAIGTEFNVSIGVRDIRVSVVEGRVRVERISSNPDGGTTELPVAAFSNLSSGEVLDFNAAGSIGIVSEVDPMLSTSWLDGRLAYNRASLESVIADVNRYSNTELIIGDEATKKLVFTGTIFSNDIDNWLDGLERVFPLRLVPVDGHEILLLQHKP